LLQGYALAVVTEAAVARSAAITHAILITLSQQPFQLADKIRTSQSR
jgi:hypothetical protein